MLILFRTSCSCDYKGRPYHHLKHVAPKPSNKPMTREELLAEQDKDVIDWQADEMNSDDDSMEEILAEQDEDIIDWQADETNSDDDSRKEKEARVWEREEERWEMELCASDQGLRRFAWRHDDGGFASICYHIEETGVD